MKNTSKIRCEMRSLLERLVNSSKTVVTENDIEELLKVVDYYELVRKAMGKRPQKIATYQ